MTASYYDAGNETCRYKRVIRIY